jgi:hypothetical protein
MQVHQGLPSFWQQCCCVLEQFDAHVHQDLPSGSKQPCMGVMQRV